MNTTDFITLYFASLAVIGGLAGYVITHLLSEIKRLNTRVDEIYNMTYTNSPKQCRALVRSLFYTLVVFNHVNDTML